MRGGVHVYRLEDDELVHVPELLRDLYDQLRCAVCHYIGRSWTMLPCEHYYCNQCVAGLLKKKAITCPECQRTYGKGSLKAARIVEKLAAKLPVWCKAPGWENGCQWQGVLDMREEHVAQCDFHPVTCPHEGCEEQAMRKDVEGHAKECDFRAVKCCHEGCSVEFQHRLGVDRRNHERMCPKRIVNCPSCGLPCAIELSSAHAKLCPKLVVSCDEECGDVVKEESNSVDGDANPRSKAPSCPQPPGSPKQANNLVPRADPISAGDASEAGSLAGSSVADLSPALPPATDPACEPNAANGAVAKKKKKKSKRSRKGKRAAGHADSAAQCLDASCDDDATSSTTETFNTPSLDPTVVDAGAPSTGSDPLTMPLTPVQSYLNTVYGVEPPVPDFGTHVHAGGESSSPLSAPEASGRHQSVLAAASAFAASVARAEDGSRSGPEVGTGGTETPLFSKLGLSLHVLEEFIMRQCGGRESLEGLTTRDVFQRYMKPFTQNSQTSYCEILKKEGHPGIREATVFVSHAWDDLFLEVVDALVHHFKEGSSAEAGESGDRGAVLWFDLFSRNQHEASPITTEWLTRVLKPGISAIGNTVLVLTASGDCRPLRRTWCLFEMLCQHDLQNLRIATCGPVELSLNITVKFQESWCPRFHIGGSECSDEEEKSRLLDAVRQMSGDWLHCTDRIIESTISRALIARLDPEVNSFAVLLQSAMLLKFEDRVDAAIQVVSGVLEALENDSGSTHPQTLRAKCFLASCMANEDASGSITMLTDVLHKQKDILGADHEDTVATVLLLCEILLSGKKFDEAKALVRDIPSAPALDMLARIYRAEGKLQEAMDVAEQALERYSSERGRHDFLTYQTMLLLGCLKSSTHQLAEAESLLRDCRDGLCRLAGFDHACSVLASLELSRTYSEQDRIPEAISLLEGLVLDKRMRLFSMSNAIVARWECFLLDFYLKSDMTVEALKLRTVLYEMRKGTFGELAEMGECHPNFLSELGEHVKRLQINELYSEAEPLVRNLFNNRKSTSGIDDVSTLEAMMLLGKNCSNVEKKEEAGDLLRDSLEGYKTALGPDNSQTVGALLALAEHYNSNDQFEESKRVLTYFLKRGSKRLGPNNKLVITAEYLLSWTFMSLGKSQTAVELAKGVVDKRMKTLGPEAVDTVEAKYLLAQCYVDTEPEIAMDLFKEAHSLEIRVYGEGHPSVQTSALELERVMAELETQRMLKSAAEQSIEELTTESKENSSGRRRRRGK